jgi:acyl phosphate:glycerol-3-phosphate acyltransferase
MIQILSWVIVIVGYLIGSIPTAYIAGRLTAGRDIRKIGDKNAGAANAYRMLGAKVGLIVFGIDVIKGILAVLLAKWFHLSQATILFTGIAVVSGHNWPIFLGFRGGRGESTTIGVLLVVFTQPVLILALPAILTLVLSKNVILTSAVIFAPLSLIGWWLHLPGILIAYSVGMPCLVFFTHIIRTREKLLIDR